MGQNFTFLGRDKKEACLVFHCQQYIIAENFIYLCNHIYVIYVQHYTGNICYINLPAASGTVHLENGNALFICVI
jgi:hypothetical protein